MGKEKILPRPRGSTFYQRKYKDPKASRPLSRCFSIVRQAWLSEEESACSACLL